MRIIAGSLGGRAFVSPRAQRTHPMSQKGRGALFNALGDITGLTLLDAFAGSGALSFEALSRGAAHATLIDSDRSAQATVAANLAQLGLARQAKLVKASANAWLGTSDDQFDLVLLDPPYDDPQLTLLSRLAERAKPGGLVVTSLPPDLSLSLGPNFELLNSKNYGDACLSFYRRV